MSCESYHSCFVLGFLTWEVGRTKGAFKKCNLLREACYITLLKLYNAINNRVCLIFWSFLLYVNREDLIACVTICN